MNFRKHTLAAGLYFVATPIGNARDITLRSLDILASADVLVAEDTRTARKLMDIHGIPLEGRSIVSFHDHSKDAKAERLAAEIAEGRSVAYVSEAGTPLVADPGYELARAAIAAGCAVFSAPGASAVLTALTVSGLGTDRFAFVGFLPSTKSQRLSELAALRDAPFTLVFYESPKRVGELLANMCEVLGADRDAALCRELTKKFEEVRRGSLSELASEYADKSVKGEVVVLVGRAKDDFVDDGEILAALEEAMKTMRIKDAATMVSGALGIPRRDVYQMALGLGKQ